MRTGWKVALFLAGASAAAVLAMGQARADDQRIERRMVIHQDGPGMDFGDIDANHDGWVTRAEALAAADRAFTAMDTNHDGKLDDSDHPDHHGGGHADAGSPHVEREVRIYRQNGDAPPVPDDARGDFTLPHPPHPPMFMMLLMNHDEFDANHDGALSREEFLNMHARFFDAADGNGDGRIKFEPPPMPPEPPAPAAPPAPPSAH